MRGEGREGSSKAVEQVADLSMKRDGVWGRRMDGKFSLHPITETRT